MIIQKTTCLLTVALLLPYSSLSRAQVVRYWEDFEPPVVESSQSAGPDAFVQINNINQNPGGWQVQGGTAGPSAVSLIAGVDDMGVAGSQSLFANWDHTGAAASNFAFNQYTVYGLPGFPAGIDEGNVKIALDVFISGSESSNSPITVVFAGNNGLINRPFFPVLANNQFTHVEFTLDQTTGSAVDLTQSFNLRLLHSGAGFGFDDDNIVRIDNVSVEAVPEPSAVAVAALSLLGAALMRRRGSRC